jgi:hypothetical protein
MNKKQINIKKLIKVNKLGLNKHFGKDNPRWNNGNRLKGCFITLGENLIQ